MNKMLAVVVFLVLLVMSAPRTILAGDSVAPDNKPAASESIVEGVERYRQAAEQGDAEAQVELGLCYSRGDGVVADMEEAGKWFCKAAEQGDAEAQVELGLCYSRGDGVVADMEEAVKWFRLAAEQRHPRAQFNLGFIIFTRERMQWILQKQLSGFTRRLNRVILRRRLNLGCVMPEAMGWRLTWKKQ